MSDKLTCKPRVPHGMGRRARQWEHPPSGTIGLEPVSPPSPHTPHIPSPHTQYMEQETTVELQEMLVEDNLALEVM